MSKLSVEQLYQIASDCANEDDGGCIYCYDQILEIDPREILAWRGKGLALGRLGRSQEAIACFDQVLRVDPHDKIAQAGVALEIENMEFRRTMKESQETVTFVGADVVEDTQKNNSVERHFCIECGSKLAPNAKFCGKCGTKIDAS